MFQNKVAPTWREQLTNVLGTYGITWFWVILAVTMIKALLMGSTAVTGLITTPPILSVLPGILDKFPALKVALGSSIFLQYFLAVFFAPVFEEIIFRLFPLTLVQKSRPEVIFAVQLAVCGVIFGLAHGSPLNVFIQGFGGFMLGRLYIINAKSMFTSWGSCALVHAAYNLTVMLAWGA